MAIRGNLGVSGCGCVARDHKGNTHAFVANRLSNDTNNVAECCTTKKVIVLGAKFGTLYFVNCNLCQFSTFNFKMLTDKKLRNY